MHELSIVQSVVDLCENSAGGCPVTSVTMELGELSGVIPEAIEFCFDACVKGTLLEGAKLVIHRIPATGACYQCNTVFSMHTCYDPCPACGSHLVTMTAGEELRVKELEVS